MSTLIGVITIVAMVAVPSYLVWMLVRTVREARRRDGLQGIWRNFSLGIIVASLFLVSWTAHGLAEWRKYVQDQRTHGEPAQAGEFVIVFGEATLQNWQSEFLEATALILLTAAYIHHGSGESKDSQDRMEKKIDRIVKKLDA